MYWGEGGGRVGERERENEYTYFGDHLPFK